MKKILLALTLCVSFAAWAGDRTDAEMRSVAMSQLMSPSARRQMPTQFHVDRLQQFDQMSVYGNEDGFVFVSHDERIKPVLGYSDGTFDLSNMPEGLRWWIQKMNACLADWRNTPDDVVVARQEAAMRLVAGYTAVPNFVKSKWDQQDPYNYYTPTVDGVKASTGCVATAMAQIIYYFQYPAQGKGEGCYFKGESNMPNRMAINTVYDYSLMKNTYSSSTSTEQKKAIGALMRDCGYAAQMSYNIDGMGSSGAHIFHAAAGMAENFSYDELAIRYYTRDYFTEAEWLKLVYDELTLKRPILYGGVDPSPGGGGHAFVLSGFDDDGLVYVNWGWSGYGNDFYDIAILNSPNGSFSAEQDMAFRFKTHIEPDPEDKYESMWIFDETGWSAKLNTSSKTLKVTYGTHYNWNFLSFNGSVGTVFENIETGEIWFDKLTTGSFEILYGRGGGSKTYKFADDFGEFPVGKYRVYFGSLHETEKSPSPVRMEGEKGAVYYELTKTDATTFALSPAMNFADLTADPTYRLVYMVDDKEYRSYNLKEGDAITPEPAPTKEHYDFSGWTPEPPATMPAHDVVVKGYFTRATAEVTLSGEGYATFYNNEVPFEVPTGVTVYVVTGVNEGKLTCESLYSGIIPTGTAVLLKGTKDASIMLTRFSGVADAYTGTNLLHGSDVATTTTASGSNLYYKLTYGQPGTYQEGIFGWYWGAAGGAAFSIEGGKAWLAVPASAAKERRFISLDDSTAGLDLMKSADAPAADVFYDLQGRRVTTPTRGLFIRNGRKVLVK